MKAQGLAGGVYDGYVQVEVADPVGFIPAKTALQPGSREAPVCQQASHDARQQGIPAGRIIIQGDGGRIQ
jgi:hypothetical protein